MENKALEIPARDATKIYTCGDFVYIEQDQQGHMACVTIHANDLEQAINHLRDLAEGLKTGL